MNESERLQILEMIEKGIISASEGVRLLNSLQGDPDEAALPLISRSVAATEEQPGINPAPEVIDQAPPPEPSTSSTPYKYESGIKKWRRFWWIPLTIGIVTTVISGLLMFLAYQKSGFGFWFACLWFPLLFGVIVISLGAASRTARWLHVRIQQAPGERPQSIGISLPVPIRFTAWILRIIKPHISGLDKASLDEAVLALEKISPDEPFYVKVDEGESGEKVEVFIG
jgi:hypothetical protein